MNPTPFVASTPIPQFQPAPVMPSEPVVSSSLVKPAIPMPGDIALLWIDEEYSMEERRAQLPRYRLHSQVTA